MINSTSIILKKHRRKKKLNLGELQDVSASSRLLGFSNKNGALTFLYGVINVKCKYTR